MKDDYEESEGRLSKRNNELSLDPVPTAVGSNKVGRLSGGTSEVLPNERKGVSFDVGGINTGFVWRGEESSKEKIYY